MDGEEPLAEWMRKRERRRAADRQITGSRWAVPLASGSRAAHINPDGPRALLEWDGHTWVTVGVAETADAAREFLGHIPEPADTDAPFAPSPMAPGTGRHRKP
ncbi:DUF6087 family protein [Streptomyces sp. NPDC054783]